MSNQVKNYLIKLNALSIFDRSSCIGDVPIGISLLKQKTHTYTKSNVPPLSDWALPPTFQRAEVSNICFL